jgi:hypothetical protein
MNLFNDPSISELSDLLENDVKSNNFKLIVEHDGEVLIENDEKKNPGILNKYKFYIRGVGKSAAKNIRYLNHLFQNLIFCWNENLKGKIDNDKIPELKTNSRWMHSHH